jgi:phosphoribosylformylglycinamidine synthase
MAKARVFVTLKKSVFDPQGKTIHDALGTLGYSQVQDVRQGKYFELDLAPGVAAAEAKKKVEEIAEKVLSNPVIETSRVEIDS